MALSALSGQPRTAFFGDGEARATREFLAFPSQSGIAFRAGAAE